MRFFMSVLILASMFIGSAATAADQPGRGFKRHDLAPGITIDFPKKWAFESFPMPIPGASNYSVEAGSLEMAITGFAIPANTASRDGKSDEDFVRDVLTDSSAQYVPLSAEKRADPISFSGPGYIGDYATFTSSTGQPIFNVFGGQSFACVSTAMVKTRDTVFTISIGSDSCSGENHRAALAALSSIRVSGS
jgi:hypothetical protein